ncbi:MAG: DUF4827 domain-containing protein [Dysgonamonadaceae bacterium]|jgi:hypothetical protein|nr:DUF4827 domain-containing protein [Dysgonamonadaceae bacterium]
MKNKSFILLATLFFLLACNNGKTYVEMLEDERNAISRYIASNNYQILNTLPADTIFQSNEFFLAENGLYLNIVKKGTPVVYKDGEKITMRLKALQLFSIEETVLSGDRKSTYLYNYPTLSQESGSSALYGQYEIISEGSVYPLINKYIGYEGVAKMIIPSKIGNSYCKSQVWPMYVEISYTGEEIPN